MEKPASAVDTVETGRLGAAVDAYAANPSSENAAAVDRAFAELAGEIAELEKRVAETSGNERTEAQAKLSELREYRAKEQVRYAEAQARAKGAQLGERIENTAERAGEKVKETGEAVKENVDKAVDRVKENF